MGFQCNLLGSLPLFMGNFVRLLDEICATFRVNRAKMGQARHCLEDTLFRRLVLNHITNSWPLNIFSLFPLLLLFCFPFPSPLVLSAVIYAASKVWSKNIKISLAEHLRATSQLLIYLLCWLLVWKTCSEIQKNKGERERRIFVYVSSHPSNIMVDLSVTFFVKTSPNSQRQWK